MQKSPSCRRKTSRGRLPLLHEAPGGQPMSAITLRMPSHDSRGADNMPEAWFKQTLVLGPHHDDAEIGPGGLIARLRRQGCTVHIAVATAGNLYQPHASRVVTSCERLHETRAAAKILERF